MSEPKFTPGPWLVAVYAIREDVGAFIITQQDGTVVAAIPEEDVGKETALENAKLISITPQLLRAVETLVHEQCQITCRDWEKECAPDCWVLEYKKLIDHIKNNNGAT